MSYDPATEAQTVCRDVTASSNRKYVIEQALRVAYEAGREDTRQAVNPRIKAPLYLNGATLPIGMLTSLTFSELEGNRRYDADLIEFMEARPTPPVDMPAPQQPDDHAFEPQPGMLYYVPMDWTPDEGESGIWGIGSKSLIGSIPPANFLSTMPVGDVGAFRILCRRALGAIKRAEKDHL